MPEDLTLAEIQAAAAVIEGVAHRTPVMRSEFLDGVSGASVHLKAEHLQKTGSFKVRGATNKVISLTDAERAAGIVAVSSGNHAAAVAFTATRLDCHATIVMPADAPDLKMRATRGYGATVITYDRTTGNRDAVAADHMAEHGGTLVHPFDDPVVMAGQGTVALEFHDQADLDVLLVPVSGGGLMAGCAVATASIRPGCHLVGVEPAGAADTFASLAAGTRQRIDAPGSIADGLLVPTPGELTFPINEQLVDEVVTVSDEAITRAMRVLFERTKQVVEPSGAVGVAALLDDRGFAGHRVGVVLSGGNISPARFARLMA
jgi:threonine dehydratase